MCRRKILKTNASKFSGRNQARTVCYSCLNMLEFSLHIFFIVPAISVGGHLSHTTPPDWTQYIVRFRVVDASILKSRPYLRIILGRSSDRGMNFPTFPSLHSISNSRIGNVLRRIYLARYIFRILYIHINIYRFKSYDIEGPNTIIDHVTKRVVFTDGVRRDGCTVNENNVHDWYRYIVYILYYIHWDWVEHRARMAYWKTRNGGPRCIRNYIVWSHELIFFFFIETISTDEYYYNNL